jgi:hypothetical protein
MFLLILIKTAAARRVTGETRPTPKCSTTVKGTFLWLGRFDAQAYKKDQKMRTMILTALAGSALLGGCTAYDNSGPGYAYRNYDYNRPDPAYGGYDASRYYNDHPRYRERNLRNQDRVYRSNDGRYYCRRSDGTTGLIIGAIAGGVLGNLIAPGDSRTLGTILGAGGGALAGQAISKRDARCR